MSEKQVVEYTTPNAEFQKGHRVLFERRTEKIQEVMIKKNIGCDKK